MHYFFDPDFSSSSTKISKDELTHFRALRISQGEAIGITTGAGKGFRAVVNDPITGELGEVQELPASNNNRIHLVQAIAKGGRDESALQAATELGIASATALQAERSISRWDSKVAKNLARWEQIAISAMKQSQNHYLPQIEFAGSVAEISSRGLGLVLDPRAKRQLGEIEMAEEVTLCVGPEGGFSELELDEFVARGFTPVRLGASILRTSSAGPAAIACLKLLLGEYGKRIN